MIGLTETREGEVSPHRRFEKLRKQEQSPGNVFVKMYLVESDKGNTNHVFRNTTEAVKTSHHCFAVRGGRRVG